MIVRLACDNGLGVWVLTLLGVSVLTLLGAWVVNTGLWFLEGVVGSVTITGSRVKVLVFCIVSAKCLGG